VSDLAIVHRIIISLKCFENYSFGTRHIYTHQICFVTSILCVSTNVNIKKYTCV